MSDRYKLQHIPGIGFGTYKLKTQKEINYSLEYALRAGYRHIDTAQLYKNEHLISHFLEYQLPELELGCTRLDIWITTKVPYFTMLECNEEKIRKSIQQSCNYFGGYVDLYLIHASNPNDMMTWRILQEYQRMGYIRYIGLSNYNLERLDNFIQRLELSEFTNPGYQEHGIYMNQIEYNPFQNRADLVARCKELGIKITAYGSLYKKNELIESLASRLGKRDIAIDSNSDTSGDNDSGIGDGNDYTAEQILLAWCASKNITVIPTSRNLQHIEANYKSMMIKLEPNDIAGLDNLHENYTRYAKHL